MKRLKWDLLYAEAKKLYLAGSSTLEIAEKLQLPVDVRSLQRRLAKEGLIRTVRQSFHIAIAKGRMSWKNRRTPKITSDLTQ